MSEAGAPKQRMQKLVRKKPLCHPGVFAMRFRDYEYSPPEHLRKIYGQVFDGLHRGGIKHLCHLKPREHGKSEAGTVDVAAWRALSDPASRTLIMSEGSKLAEKKLDQVRTIIEGVGPRYGVGIEDNNNLMIKLANDANHGEATVEAAGFGSSVTGGHFDVIIFDDLVDWPSQRTEARREKIWSQFQNYLNLGSEGETVYLVLGTRKHPDDLYSNLMASGSWYVDVDKAIQDWSIVEEQAYDLVLRNPETGEERTIRASDAHTIGDDEAIVRAEPHRHVETLWPERWPVGKLLVDMHSGFGEDQGNLVWRRENQNDAQALQGQVLMESMLHFSEDEDVEEQPPLEELQIIYGLDPAIEDDPEKAATKDTDFWGLAKLGHDNRLDTTFVLNVWRERGLSMRRGMSWARHKIDGRPNAFMVEDAQAQRWFVQEMKDLGLNVRGSKSKGSKEDRIIQMSARVESGRVVFAGSAEDWSGPSARVPKFINEWASFPSGSHDDRLDAIEIGLRGVSRKNISSNGHSMSDLPL